jgi:hypothetical protein
MLVMSARNAVCALVFAGHACAETPSSSGVVVAPVVPPSSAPVVDAASPVPAPSPDASADASVPGPAANDGGVPAQFRACAVDTDCVAVPRVGCCHNGWNEAVAASQKDAYAASFVCPQAHPICAMFLVRDTRSPRCNTGTHLCELVAGH